MKLLDIRPSGLDDINTLALGVLNTQGVGGRPSWVEAAALATIVTDPDTDFTTWAIKFPGGASHAAIFSYQTSGSCTVQQLNNRTIIISYDIRMDSDLSGAEGASVSVQLFGNSSRLYANIIYTTKVAGLEIDWNTGVNVTTLSLAANTDTWISNKIIVDTVNGHMTPFINGLVPDDDITGLKLYDIDDGASATIPVRMDSLHLQTATSVAGEDIHFKNIVVDWGDKNVEQLLEEKCSAPFFVVEIETTDTNSPRRYSDLTRVAAKLDCFDELSAIFDGRVVSFGSLTEQIQFLTGDIAPSRVSIQIANPPVEMLGVLGTSGTDSPDRAVVMGADARESITFFQSLKIYLGYDGVHYSPTAGLNDYRLIYEGNITDSTLNNGVVTFTAIDPIAQILGESTTIGIGTSDDVGIQGTITATDFANAPAESLGKLAPIIYGTLAKATGITKGRVPLIPVGDITDSGTAYKLIASGHRLTTAGTTSSTGINVVYRLRDDVYTSLTFTTDWTSAQDTGTDITDAVTVDILTGGSRFQDGDLFFADVLGRDDDGDGTGTLLTDPTDVLEDYLNSFTDLSTYGITLNDAAIAATRLVTAPVTGRSYLAAGYIDSKLPVAQVFKDICQSFQFRPFSTDNQVTKKRELGWDIFNIDLTEVDLARVYDSRINAADVSITPNTQWLVNRVELEYQKDFATKQFDTILPRESESAQGNMNNRVVTKPIKLPWVQDTLTATDVGGRILAEFSLPVNVVTFTAPLLAELDDPTALIKLTHYEGINADGKYDKQLFEIMAKRTNMDNLSRPIMVTARDLRNLQAARLLSDDDAESTDTDRSTVRVNVNTRTASLIVGSNQAILSGDITFKTGDIIDFGSFDHSSFTPGTKFTNFFKAYINSAPNMNFLGAEVTVSTIYMFSDITGTVKNAGATQNPVDFVVFQSWPNADENLKSKYWFLSDVPTDQFTNGDPGHHLF